MMRKTVFIILLLTWFVPIHAHTNKEAIDPNACKTSFVTSNRKCNTFVFIDIFKSCIILGLIFQQSFNYHERL